ncbi:hypothetical protein CaCOL14_012794 [Colletotrichum acutatum]
MGESRSVEELSRLLRQAEERAKAAERERQQEQQRAEAAERNRQQERQRAEAEQQRAEAAERDRQQERQRADEAEQQTQPTSLDEYITACHSLVYIKFTVETDLRLTSKGSITNPRHKWCPTNLQPWPDFLQQQRIVFGTLYDTFPSDRRCFESRSFLSGLGSRIARRKITDEKALEYFLHNSVEDPVRAIMDELKKVEEVNRAFDLGNGIVFENHPHVISDAAEEVVDRNVPSTPPSTPHTSTVDLKQLRADQICVYRSETAGSESRTMLYVSEYKPPHKLTAPHLRLGLRPMNIYKEVVNRKTIPTSVDPDARFQYHAERLTSAAITQTYHYMIEGGLEHGLLTTGEAIVFLMIDWREPETLFYHLAEPSAEAEAHPEHAHLCTAVAQYLAFSLIALSMPGERSPHGQDERREAMDNLKMWAEDFETTLRSVPDGERQPPESSPGYEPKAYENVDRSPCLHRKTRRGHARDRHTREQVTKDPNESSESSDDESRRNMPATPTPTERRARGRNPQSQGGQDSQGTRRSQRLLALRPRGGGEGRGGVLDPGCPNTFLHRRKPRDDRRHNHGSGRAETRHPIDHTRFVKLLGEQLERTLDDGVTPLGQGGARGVLFKISLLAYGYTFVSKGTVRAFIEDLEHEAAVYDRLRPIQVVHGHMALPSPPPSQPTTPHGLTDRQSRRLEALQLHLNEPEPVLICRPCGYALKPFGERVSRHLAEKHNICKSQRRGLSALVKTLDLGDPNDVAPRPDGLPAHQSLTVTRGHACRHCSYRTASDDLICRHISKTHGIKDSRKADGWQRDHIYSGILLQSWSQNGTRGFWIAQPRTSELPPLGNDMGALGAGDPSPQAAPAAQQQALLAAAHHAERAYLASSPCVTTAATGQVDVAFQTGWMRRAGWDLMFDGARRDLLVKMSQLPALVRDRWEAEDDMPHASSREDEARLQYIMSAVDGVFDRCEDTIRHTDVSMRCWLRSSEPYRPYKAPFELVGRRSSTYRYRRSVKRLLCFCIRLWRLPLGTRLSHCQRSLTIAQSHALETFWSDGIWNTLRRDDAPVVSHIESDATPADEESSRGDLKNSSDCHDVDDGSATETSDDSDYEDLPSEGLECLQDHDHKKMSVRTYATEDRLSTDVAAQPLSFLDRGLRGDYFSTALEDLTLRLLYFLMTEEFEDGQSKSTLLVYFSGVLGLTSDGSGFQSPGNYTANLSAFIYCVRLIVIEVLLPRTSHDYVGYPARPRHGQLEILNRVRRETMCLASQAPLGEFLSLRAYGRTVSPADGPSFRFSWSDDGQTISWDDGRLSLQRFRSLAHDMVQHTASAVDRLMYGWHPVFDLSKTKDRMANTNRGYSFVSEPANGLQEAYLDLSQRACLSTIDGLLSEEGWLSRRVHRYIDDSEALLSALFALVHLTGGQAARGSELASVQYQNGTSTPRGVYVYSGALVLITRHHKTRHTTNNEFQVARFLPDVVGRLLYLYLVYIRPFTSMLTRACLCAPGTPGAPILFASPSRPDTPWSTDRLSKELLRATTQFTGQPINTRTYRQLSIAITERHVKQIHSLSNQYDDRGRDAPIESAFAWQSGHRPLQRAATYGLDGAYPDSLQPALLERYRWVSRQWHGFLRLEACNRPTRATTWQVDSAPSQKDASSSVITTPRTPSQDAQSTTRKRQESPTALVAPPPEHHHPNKRTRLNTTSEPSEATTLSIHCVSDPPTGPDTARGSADTNSAEPQQRDSRGPASPQSGPGTEGGNEDTSSAEHQQQDTIDPFVFNAEFSVALCKTCRYAVVSDEVMTHLRTQHRGIRVAERKRITDRIQSLHGIVRSQTDLQSFRYPGPNTPPIAHLAVPKTDGIRCAECQYVCRQLQTIQSHCRTEHGWMNDWQKGGNVRKRAKAARILPWTTGVPCQRLFLTRAGCRWFEVGRDAGVAVDSSEPAQ